MEHAKYQEAELNATNGKFLLSLLLSSPASTFYFYLPSSFSTSIFLIYFIS